jgi:hypothetical protein
MAGRSGLPNETVNYLAAVAPNLGNDIPMSGPLAAYADSGGAPLRPDPIPRSFAQAPRAQCWQDPNAAYDPDAPCRAAPPLVPEQPRIARAARSDCYRDPDTAYDPAAPCEGASANAAWGQGAPNAPAPAVQLAEAAPSRQHYVTNLLVPAAAAATLRPVMTSGGWAIQIGAFADPQMALQVAERARSMAPRELGRAQTMLGPTARFGGAVLYRARLQGLTAQSAAAACEEIGARRQACVTVPPGG